MRTTLLETSKLTRSCTQYAGQYVPCVLPPLSYSLIRLIQPWPTDIANYIYEHPGSVDLDLKGIWIADRKLICT